MPSVIREVFGNRKKLGRLGGIALDESRNRLYVVNGLEHTIEIFNMDGMHVKTLGSRGIEVGEFNFPYDLDVDSDDSQ